MKKSTMPKAMVDFYCTNGKKYDILATYYKVD